MGEPRKSLFDPDCYQSGTLSHFLVKGAFEGRQPHPLFDPAFYLRKYPDVAAAGVNPFCHYLKHGYKELRQPHPLFDPAFYLSRNPDVRLAGLDPLLHYLRHGAVEDRKPQIHSSSRNTIRQPPGSLRRTRWCIFWNRGLRQRIRTHSSIARRTWKLIPTR